jgi:hypothetical protein
LPPMPSGRSPRPSRSSSSRTPLTLQLLPPKSSWALGPFFVYQYSSLVAFVNKYIIFIVNI